ncbi:hypothetical protein CR492_11740 [Methylocella silvestris]|uniref:Uncharacterized protein n=1 Tax=Methylocella silvestris TaxID=199596 RepID=A0A2J7TG98_METSI|nr:hypothetical protein CR492_11740 [Methylocella silvestris]
MIGDDPSQHGDDLLAYRRFGENPRDISPETLEALSTGPARLWPTACECATGAAPTVTESSNFGAAATSAE